METKTVLLDMNLSELEEYLRSLGEADFRAKQLYQWVYSSLATDFDQMTNLPRPLRQKLGESAIILPLRPISTRVDDNGLTRKVLFELLDGRTIESVLLIYEGSPSSKARRTVCVSSQVGCAIGCPFCATGAGGFERNLTAGEIVGQVLYFARELASGKMGTGRITNVVYMGQGEPLANFESVLKSVELLNSPYGFNLGARHITISTAGIPHRIRELARWPMQVGLAISLHAPNNDLRNRLVPINRRYPIEDLIAACKEYIKITNRRLTFEYALIWEVNDSVRHARELAKLLRGMLCHVNLIPLNATSSEFRPTSKERIDLFAKELGREGIATTVRVARGSHIEAACGQLKSARVR